MLENKEIVSFGCLVYSFSLTNICSFIFWLSVLRVASLTHMNFLDETIGESLIRKIIAIINFSCGISVCIAQWLSGEVLTGTIYNVLAKDNIPAGKLRFKSNLIYKLNTITFYFPSGRVKSTLNSIFYLLDLLSVTLMQCRIEYEKELLDARQYTLNNLSIIDGSWQPQRKKKSSGYRWKTGLVAIVVSSAMGILCLLNIKKMEHQTEYYIIELFIFCCVFFTVLPVLGLKSNKDVLKYASNRRNYTYWMQIWNGNRIGMV